MGDDEGGPSLHQLLEAVLDVFFCDRIEGGGRFVEDEDRGRGEEGAGDRDPLPLAAGELGPPLANEGGVPIGAFSDELVAVGKFCGMDDLFPCGIDPSVLDVLFEGAVEEEGVLGDEGDLVAQGVEGDGCDILAIDQNPSLFQGEKAEDQVDKSGLSGAGVTDEADFLPSANVEGLVVEKLLLSIAEGDVVKLDLPLGNLQRGSTRERRGCPGGPASR